MHLFDSQLEIFFCYVFFQGHFLIYIYSDSAQWQVLPGQYVFLKYIWSHRTYCQDGMFNEVISVIPSDMCVYIFPFVQFWYILGGPSLMSYYA